MKLIFATHNPGKVIEMRAILAGLPVDILSADEAGVNEDVVEDGATFAENALKKARFVCQRTGQWAIGDDSGLSIDSLDGAPGVNSARWAGEGVTGDQLVRHTLKKLEGVPENLRTGSFETTAAVVAPDGKEWVFRGCIRGTIPLVPRGTPRPRLPYDVIFVPEGHTKTFAEMSDEEKNSLSHRGEAFQQVRDFITNVQRT